MTIRTTFFSIFLLCSLFAQSQQTRLYTDPLQQFRKARELYQSGQYASAYPLFLDLRHQLDQGILNNYRIAAEEIEFYTIACGLIQLETTAEKQALNFTQLSGNSPLKQKISFQLANYYFFKNEYRNAILYYEESNTSNLSAEEEARMDFRLGYSYFTIRQYNKAKPLLNKAANNQEGEHYADANYYFGILVFSDKKYNDALEHFKRVEAHPQYKNIVPYYIASIYYQQGKKDQAVSYAENILKKDPGVSYNAGLKRMVGHAWFEKRQFAKALPYLEEYLAQTDKPSREDLYQVSYCYYETRQYPRAIPGFKQLTDGMDSLSQSAMYLLGDAYLKTGQKENARNAFSFSARNNSHPFQREVSLFHYAKLSYELGFQDLAITEMRSFLSQYPQSTFAPEGRELLVGMLAGTNNFREALTLLESSPVMSSSMKQLYPRILYGRAMEQIGDEDLVSADGLLERLLNTASNTPFSSAARFWRGEIALRQNRPDAAIRFLQSYLDAPTYRTVDINQENARYSLGYALLRSENYTQARNQFDAVLTKTGTSSAQPMGRDALLRSADCSYMLRDFSKARSQYQSAVSGNWPDADYATWQLAMIAGVNNSSEKLKLLEGFNKKFPSSQLSSSVSMEIAAALLADERYKEAIPYLNQLLITEKSNAAIRSKAYLRLGIAYYNLNNNKQALDNYQKLLTEFPNAPEVEEALESARAIFLEEGKTNEYVAFAKAAGRPVSETEQDSLTFASAESRYASGNPSAAIKSLSDYLTAFPSGAHVIDALYMRSDLYLKQKDFTNALKGFEELTARAPNKFAEKAAAQAASILYFDLKDYARAESFFLQSKAFSTSSTGKLDAMRGLLRCQYQLKKWEDGSANATELLNERTIGTDDRVLASMMLGKAHQAASRFTEAISQFRTVISLSKAAYAAEARYETAAAWLALDDLKNAEKAAFETINKSGSYDFWITRAYILLADVFLRQQDVFNAKATLQSVVDNSRIPELKQEAETKLASLPDTERKK